jgi:hypothetical protein
VSRSWYSLPPSGSLFVEADAFSMLGVAAFPLDSPFFRTVVSHDVFEERLERGEPGK